MHMFSFTQMPVTTWAGHLIPVLMGGAYNGQRQCIQAKLAIFVLYSAKNFKASSF